MAWTETCKIDFKKQIDHKREQGISVRNALKQLSEESEISINTLNSWLYPRECKKKESVVENYHTPDNIFAKLSETEISNIEPEGKKEIVRLAREITQEERANKQQERVDNQVERDNQFKEIPLPDKRYSILYLDPPWRYEHSISHSRDIENQYPTMSLNEIKAMEIPADENCIIFMWATSPKLFEAFEVLQAWGFIYKTCAVWVKDKIGLGYYFRQQHELLLIATQGTPVLPAPEDRISSVLEYPRLQHSAKPKEVYDIIDNMYPGITKLEMFSRGNDRKLWDQWGNEVE